jgi:hypothetical protein
MLAAQLTHYSTLSLSLSLPNHDSAEAFENAKHDSKTQSYKTPNAKPKDENKTKLAQN